MVGMLVVVAVAVVCAVGVLLVPVVGSLRGARAGGAGDRAGGEVQTAGASSLDALDQTLGTRSAASER